jgi:uncharacterized repeat protein (TIGR03837 family)
MRWDIFCRVIDNFGDAGIAWRLAKCLVDDHQHTVRLIIDHPKTLSALVPSFEADRPTLQTCEGIEIRHWTSVETDAHLVAAQGVIEIFACALPAHYLAKMKAASPQPCWVNYEYLSAESWIKEVHNLESLQTNGLKKRFFFPGFESGTGGLLREGDYFQKLAAWQTTQATQTQTQSQTAFQISLFGYENAALPALIESWSNAPTYINARIFEGRLFSSLPAHWRDALSAHPTLTMQQLTLIRQPFVAQADYDEILWASDLNFVRGEESFVRAQWAGKPFIWHIYPTEDQAHLAKLSAFLELYCKDLSAEEASAYRNFSMAWNHQQHTGEDWRLLVQHWPALCQHAQNWQTRLLELGDCATNLLKSCIKSV